MYIKLSLKYGILLMLLTLFTYIGLFEFFIFNNQKYFFFKYIFINSFIIPFIQIIYIIILLYILYNKYQYLNFFFMSFIILSIGSLLSLIIIFIFFNFINSKILELIKLGIINNCFEPYKYNIIKNYGYIFYINRIHTIYYGNIFNICIFFIYFLFYILYYFIISIIINFFFQKLK